MTDLDNLSRLLAIMARLHDPERGRPWDREHNFASIAPETIEEAYEVAEAIAQGDTAALRDELGDLLFQVVFHARMAEEARLFDFDDVAKAIADKMVRRTFMSSVAPRLPPPRRRARPGKSIRKPSAAPRPRPARRSARSTASASPCQR